MMRDTIPVLFIPALAMPGELYEDQIKEIGRKHPVIIADHRQDDNFPDMAQRILKQAPEQFALIGLSMGGYAAFEIMRQAPQRVSQLVLMDTNHQTDNPEKRLNRERQIAIAQSGKYESLLEPMWQGLVAPQRIDDASLKKRVTGMMRQTGADIFIRQQKAILTRLDSTPLLTDIRIPTLVIVGAQDQLTSPELAAKMADAIPDSRLEIVPDCGHLSVMEQPEAVTSILQRWFDR